MTDTKITNLLLGALILLSFTMFIWTANYIHQTEINEIPMAISAFNG